MNLILAADENWAIGYGGDLLCHIPGDLKFFKEKTLDKTVVMGRATLESLPGHKGLPKRNNIVITGKADFEAPGIVAVHSEEELMKELAKYDDKDVFIMGGEQVYKEFLHLCDTCYITKIYDKFKADRYFVDLDKDDDFQVTWQSEVMEENGIKYRFMKYERR
jgi:Dihydrofolate reductase